MAAGAAKAPSVPPTAGRPRRARNTNRIVRTLPGYVRKDGDQLVPVELVQDEMTFFEKNEFVALVVDAIDDAIQKGLDFEAIVKAFDFPDDIVEKIRAGEMKISEIGLGKILPTLITRFLSAVPRLMEDTYLIALGVEPELRDRVRTYLRQIDDETGFAVLDTFIEQNASHLASFFERWVETVQKAVERIAGETTSDSSTT